MATASPARSIATIPRGRAAAPDDIARAARFRAGPQADFITGQGAAVDGGGVVITIATPHPARGSPSTEQRP